MDWAVPTNAFLVIGKVIDFPLRCPVVWVRREYVSVVSVSFSESVFTLTRQQHVLCKPTLRAPLHYATTRTLNHWQFLTQRMTRKRSQYLHTLDLFVNFLLTSETWVKQLPNYEAPRVELPTCHPLPDLKNKKPHQYKENLVLPFPTLGSYSRIATLGRAESNAIFLMLFTHEDLLPSLVENGE